MERDKGTDYWGKRTNINENVYGGKKIERNREKRARKKEEEKEKDREKRENLFNNIYNRRKREKG